MKVCVILCSWAFVVVESFNFNINNVKEIRLNSGENTNNTYFGYALLLQRGPKSIVIAGAPKNSKKAGGSVYACDVDTTKCIKYNIVTSNGNSSNGNFLGSALDGDDFTGGQFITCAPRTVKVVTRDNYLKGVCFAKKNSSSYESNSHMLNPLDVEKPISSANGQYYYDFAFGEAGIDMNYIKKTGKVLLGAPGVKNWNGAVVVQSLYNDYTILPNKNAPVKDEDNAYLGYKVTSAKFDSARQNILYVAGAPRANKLFGAVKIFSGLRIIQSLKGDEMGSYFGSSLLALDVNNDLSDELLVGAPTGAGATYDEGYVYVYGKSFQNRVTLVGQKKTGARFGSSIADLGDIDLDSYKDVAISAPYDDDGVGAVYIYMGGRNGIKSIFSQKLSPLKFNGGITSVRGFGHGISKGNDIDGNGHNDIAIGAYQSNQVFIVRTKSIIDFSLSLETNVSTISDKPMNVKYCAYYTQRSKAQDLKIVNFKWFVQLDYRVSGSRAYNGTWNVAVAERYCQSLDAVVKRSVQDISPFKLSYSVQIVGDMTSVGENTVEKSIRYSHECGNNNICETQILLNVVPKTNIIRMGLDKELDVEVSAENLLEPGFECKLHLNMAPEVEPRNKDDCSFENETYICPFASKISSVRKETRNLIFDVISINLVTKRTVDITFEVKCLGENLNPKTETLTLDVFVQNSPYIKGTSDPETVSYDDGSMTNDAEIFHIFKVGNFGPSPIKLNVTLLVPMVKNNDADIFKFVEAKGILNGIQVQCHLVSEKIIYNVSYEKEKVLTTPLNRTIVLDCSEDQSNCLKIRCEGDYLSKSSQVAQLEVKILAKANLLASHFSKELSKKDFIAYVSSGFFSNSTNTIDWHVATLIIFSNKESVALWIYIVSIIAGIILLSVLVFFLYKCHFFDRRYRDKLNGERLMDQHIEVTTDGEIPNEERE